MTSSLISIENSRRLILRLDPDSIPDLNITIGPDLTSSWAQLDKNAHLAITPISGQKHGENHSLSVTVLKPVDNNFQQFNETQDAFLHLPESQYRTAIELLANAEHRIRTQSESSTDDIALTKAIEAIFTYGSIVGPATLVS